MVSRRILLCCLMCFALLCSCGKTVQKCEPSSQLNKATSEFGIAHIYPKDASYYIIVSASTESGLRTTLSLILLHDYLNALDENELLATLEELTSREKFMDKLMNKLVDDDYTKYRREQAPGGDSENRVAFVRYARDLISNTVCEAPDKYMGIEAIPNDYYQCTAHNLWQGLTSAHPELNCIKRVF
ncbi:hypothetical protein ACFLU6_05025 [Acidobacteriota bacterium]